MLGYPCLKKSAFKKKLYTLFFEKRNLKNAAAIHFISEKEKDTIEGIKLNNQYSVAVPHGLDMDKFKNLGHFKGLFKKYYPQVSGKKIILFLSRVDPIKGMDLLIPALRILLNKRHDFIFVVAGPSSGDYQSWVREALGDAGLIKSTIFTGFLDGWMKFAAFADSDIFVLPSYHENFGLAVVEAMAAALPVVVSNKVDIYKLIEDYRAGIVAGMNSQEIALGLDRLLSDEYLRQQMGANGVKLAEENFDIKKIARQMQEIYAQLITKNYYSGAVS
jgi:glycosyltransferase involved in cell wall biosynthesis